MKRYLLFISILVSLFFVLPKAKAQGNQKISNGAQSTAVNFTGPGCTYSWTNDKPGIGLPASGIGNIASFTGVNTGTTPITATIIATPAPTGYAYISNNASNSVSVINTISNTVVTAVTVGQAPFGIAISPDGSKVYVANIVSNTVSVIAAATNTVLTTINVGTFPYAIAMSPDGSTIYVANDGSNNVSVISTATNTVTNTITVGNTPYAIAISADGSRVYVANNLSFNVSVINTATQKVISTITVGRGPEGVVVSPDGKKIYVTNVGAANVSVIDVTNNSLITNIPVGSSPEGISISPDGSHVYVANYGSNNVSVINTSTNSVATTIGVGSGPYGLAVSTDGTEVYVANSESNNVSVIATATNTVTNTVAVGSVPDSQGNFVSPATTCIGSVVTFTITVNPASVKRAITIGTVTGATDACVGTPSASPYTEQFTVSGSNLTNDIIASAPPNFEVSLSAGSGYGSSVTLTQTGGTVASTEVFVRSSASAATGSISGNVVVSSGTISKNVPVVGTINALPSVVAVNNQTVINGQNTTAVNFTGTGDTYSWTNDTPGIGLADSGTGNIAPFAPLNDINTPITATITVTPENTTTGCSGPSITFTITVNPTASFISPGAVTGNISACIGAASASPEVEQFAVSGSNLTNDITATAPAGFEVSLAEGSGYSPNVTLKQTAGAVTNQVVYVRSAASAAAGNYMANVVLSSTGAGNQNVMVSGVVSPEPAVNQPDSQTLLNGAATAPISFSGTGNTYTWTNDTPTIGLPASGTGNISAFTAVNNGSTPITATVTVTPQPSPGYAYIDFYTSNIVNVVNTQTGTVVANNLPVGINPAGIAISPDGSKVYVANAGASSISVIDIATNTVTATIAGGSKPFSLVISPDGSLIYASDLGDNTVTVINTSTGQIVGTPIPVGKQPESICITPDGKTVYVSSVGGVGSEFGTVSVISTSLNAVITTISGLRGSGTICASRDGKQVYVTNEAVPGTVSVISTATNTIVNAIPVGPVPSIMAISPDGGRLYVCNANQNSVSIINTATNVVLSTVSVGLGIVAIAVSSDGSKVYVLSVGSLTMSVIDAATNVVSSIAENVGLGSFENFVSPGSTCPGTPMKFTITVNPIVPLITPGPVSGVISACAGTASASPDIEQFTVSGTKLTTDITVTAPSGFEVSLAAASGYGSSVSLTQTGGAVNNQVVYVRSAASAPAGAVMANVVLSSSGVSSQNVMVNGVVSPLPIIAPVTGQNVNNGSATTPVSFNGTANSYTWTNDTPSIGLPASGTGNIAAFTAVNNGTAAVKATITVTPLPSPGYAYIDFYAFNTLSVYNTETNTIIANPSVGNHPWGITLSPDGNTVYVANLGSNSISVISTVTNTLVSTFNNVLNPSGLAISPDGNRLYVTDILANTVSVVNTTTGQLIGSAIPVGNEPMGICISPNGDFLYVSNTASKSVSVINTATDAVTTIAINTPGGLCLSPDGNTLYVASALGPGTVYVINTSTNSITGTIAVGNVPSAMVLSPDGGRLYVANADDATVSIINTATSNILATVKAGLDINGISVTSDGRKVYVSNQNSNSISVIDAATNTVSTFTTPTLAPSSFGNFISPGSTCSGNSTQFTITVNGSNPIITPGPVSGVISACAGTASASPDIEQFTVSGSNLTNNITATAPSGFEVSLAAASGYGSNVTLTQIGGTVASTVVYVRSSAIAPVGAVMANVVLSSSGVSSQNVMVNGVVSAPSSVNQAANQNLLTGTATAPVSFIGTGNNEYTWVNDTPGIGLPTAGTGNIAAYTVVNNTNAPIKATITVTPKPIPAYAYIDYNLAGTMDVVNTENDITVATPLIGGQPAGVAISPDGSLVYVANQTSGSISVISTATNTVTSKITCNGLAPYDMVVSPDGSRLYVTNTGGNSVSVINSSTGQLISTIPVGQKPETICISPDGSTVYVVNATNGINGTVSVINTSSNTVTATIIVNVGFISGIAISPDGSRIYVTRSNKPIGSVAVINTTTNAIIDTIAVGSYPVHMAISPDGGRLYVSNNDDNTVSIINTATQAVLATVAAGSGLGGIAVTSDGRRIYVLNGGTISVIDAATNTVSGFPISTVDPFSINNFILPGSTCSGATMKFTITVNPITPFIIPGAVSGNISACVGEASASPEVELFNVSGSNLTNDITATAPAGFEVSLVSGSGYGTTVTLKQAGGVVNQGVYVRSAASDAVGDYMANVVLSSTGASSQSVMVNGVVSPEPSVNQPQPGSQTVLNGAATTPVPFTGTGNSYTWTNDTPTIGLPASGTGNIAAFTAVNNGPVPVTATVTVTPQPSPGYAYIDFFLSGTVNVINTQTGAVVAANLPVGTSPAGVAISPDGSKVYVANTGSSSISVIDIATNTVTTTIAGGSKPYSLVVTPDGSRIYASDLGNNSVTVINTATGQIIGNPIKVGNQPENICVTPDGNTVYVINSVDGTVSVISTLVNAVIATITNVNSPGNMCISRDGKQLYVTNGALNTVSVISTATNTITATIPVGYEPFGIAISPDGGRLYVCNINNSTVSIINTATNTVFVSVGVNSGQNGIAVSSDGRRVYLLSSVSQTMSVIDASTNTVTSFPVSIGLGSYDNFVSPGSTCSGPTKTFTITVNPSIPPAITATGSPSPLTTTYGMASSSTTFTMSGTNMQGGILVTPPPGFEVSTDGVSFSPTVNTGVAGTIASTTIYIRLAATTAVGSNYGGNIVLSSEGATSVNVAMPVSTVTPAQLTITALELDKLYGSTLTTETGVTAVTSTSFKTGFTSIGLQNNETIGSITVTFGPGSAATDIVGVYPNSVNPSAATGGTFMASNYTITYIDAQLNVTQTALSINADNKSKIAGTENPPLTLTYSGFVNNEDTTNLTTMPTVTTTATINSPPGKYPIMVSGAADPNYVFFYFAGVLTVTPYEPTIVIPNTFTPNGDGINDYWDIKYLESYPKCTVAIYNRYGEKLYSSIGYPTPWDGTYKGSYLPSGAYYYIINLKNGSSVLSGWVAIIR